MKLLIMKIEREPSTKFIQALNIYEDFQTYGFKKKDRAKIKCCVVDPENSNFFKKKVSDCRKNVISIAASLLVH